LIDLHSHILPALDDGAPDLETSVAIAQAAAAEGVQTMIATPHVNFDYPTASDAMHSAVGHVNVALARAEVALAVLPGAEIAVTKLEALSNEELGLLALAGGRTLLVESPYTTSVPFLEKLLDDLLARGYQVVLAHPERSPLFRADISRLRRLIGDGIYSAVNIGSLAGRFGDRSQETALELMTSGLVHALASDCHDVERRPPGFRAGVEEASSVLPGLEDQLGWYCRDAPGALLAGRELPSRPEPLERTKQKRRLPLLGRKRT
jgi:protein-tyrosine phosphatase